MFYILRHGRTDWNEEHRLQGEVDIPLNETGRQMAYDAAEKYTLTYATAPRLREHRRRQGFFLQTETLQ